MTDISGAVNLGPLPSQAVPTVFQYGSSGSTTGTKTYTPNVPGQINVVQGVDVAINGVSVLPMQVALFYQGAIFYGVAEDFSDTTLVLNWQWRGALRMDHGQVLELQWGGTAVDVTVGYVIWGYVLPVLSSAYASPRFEG
jgi:hypothetical protein